jgi:hypothetical protein
MKENAFFKIISSMYALGMLLFFLFACSPPKEQIPNDILTPEKMAHLLADLKIVDAAYQTGTNPLGRIAILKDSTPQPIDSLVALGKRMVRDKKKPAKADSVSLVNGGNDNRIKIETNETQDYLPENSFSKSTYYRGHTGADYAFVLQKHGLNSAAFEYNLNYYAARPELFYPVVEKSLEILSIKLSELEKNKPQK